MFLLFQSLPASANVSPVVESFTATPNDIELTGKSTRVEFELVVSHPAGIASVKTEVTITNNRRDTLIVTLNRTDSPIDSKRTKVVFRGSIDLPRDLNSGAYTYSSSPVLNNSTAGYQYTTGTISGPKLRELVGAEYGILVRNFGDLNLDYAPFNGPAYDTTLGIAYENSIKYNANNSPIWKVGETYNPIDYFELRVPNLPLNIATTTPKVCSSDGKVMTFISEGSCNFTVSTPKTSSYVAKSVNQNATITSARVKIQLTLEKIENQTSQNLPKTIEVSHVYSAATGYVFPVSETPTVCLASGYFVKLISGGTCTLSYKSQETPTYRASDTYFQTFEIVRNPQTIEFLPPSRVEFSSNALPLTAKASGGGEVTYSSSTPEICSVIGSSLNLLKVGTCSVTATQLGNATTSPISKSANIEITQINTKIKTITCVKPGKKVTASGPAPKCPKGYKVLKKR